MGIVTNGCRHAGHESMQQLADRCKFRVALISRLQEHGLVPNHDLQQEAIWEDDEEGLLLHRTARWADLPTELITHIATNLDATRDRIAAMCTCRPWRDAIAATTTSLAFQFPPGQRTTIRRVQQHNALVKLAAHHCVDVRSIVFAQWHGLDDAALVALLSHAAPRVELTDASMLVLAEHAQALEQLSVCGCGALTDVGVVAVGRGCRRLQCVNLGWCEAVGDAGVGALAAAVGPRLLDIDLCGCFRVTDSAVVWLAWHCPNLVRLDLHCCRRITNASLVAIAEQLHALCFLNLSGCRKISPEILQAVLDANRDLHTCKRLRNVILGGKPSLLQASCPCPLRRL